MWPTDESFEYGSARELTDVVASRIGELPKRFTRAQLVEKFRLGERDARFVSRVLQDLKALGLIVREKGVQVWRNTST